MPPKAISTTRKAHKSWDQVLANERVSPLIAPTMGKPEKGATRTPKMRTFVQRTPHQPDEEEGIGELTDSQTGTSGLTRLNEARALAQPFREGWERPSLKNQQVRKRPATSRSRQQKLGNTVLWEQQRTQWLRRLKSQGPSRIQRQSSHRLPTRETRGDKHRNRLLEDWRKQQGR